MPPDTSTGPGSTSARLLAWMQRLLIGVGVCLLVWVGLITADARIAQTLARESLRTAPRAAGLSPTVHARPVVLSRGAPIGELTIPRVHLSAMVLHGSDTRTLRRGPGHIEHTALPGQPGNVAVAGHRDTFFRPIREVRVGDDIYIDTADARFHYRVSSLNVVAPNAVDVLDATDVPTLTLVTCFPFWLAGPAPDRFVVRATEVDRQDTGSVLPRATVASDVPAREIGVGQSIAPTRQIAHAGGQAAEGQPAVRTARDEPADVAVRRAIDHFRVAYNLRLTRRPEGSPTSPLALGRCDIAVKGPSAVATCDDVSTLPEGRQWIFSLRADNGTWNIVSVEPR